MVQKSGHHQLIWRNQPNYLPFFFSKYIMLYTSQVIQGISEPSVFKCFPCFFWLAFLVGCFPWLWLSYHYAPSPVGDSTKRTFIFVRTGGFGSWNAPRKSEEVLLGKMDVFLTHRCLGFRHVFFFCEFREGFMIHLSYHNQTETKHVQSNKLSYSLIA